MVKIVEFGKIIFLNGTSSSGKTTLANALQLTLPLPYMRLSIDDFLNFYPEKFMNPDNPEGMAVLARLIPCVVSGFHKSAAVLAKSGNALIVEHVLQKKDWLIECVKEWKDLDVLFVGVKCELSALEQREAARADRSSGTARYQYDRVHAQSLYDIEVDTSIQSVDECVSRIIKAVNRKPVPSAFSQLALRFKV
jgi:chloramphenicol 3-O phosphotransferase